MDTSFLKQYAETRGFMLGRPQKPKVTPDGKAVLFLRAEPTVAKMKLFEFDVATGKTKELLSPESLLKGAEENLTPEEKARRERQRVSVGGFADFALSPDGSRVLVKLANKLYVLERATGKATELKTGTEGAIVDPKWSPDGKLVGYVRGYDVYVYDLAAEKESAVTTGGTVVKTHGLAEFVAQEEMHRHSGFWFSPDSKSIAYEEADHTGVETWYVADPLKPEVKPAEQFYPRPGKKNVAVRLGVIPVTGGETVWIEWDRKKFEYLGRVAFAKNGLWLALQSRDQQTLACTSANPFTGSVGGGTIYQFSGTPGMTWLDLPPEPLLLAGGETLAVCKINEAALRPGSTSNRPFRTLLCSFPAPNKMQERGPAIDVSELLAYDLSSHAAVFTARPDPTQIHVYRTVVNPAGEGRTETPLTTDPGIHSAVFSKDQKLAVITSTTLKQMPRTDVVIVEGAKLGLLPSVAVEPPFVPNVTIQKVGDGEGYWTGVVRPRGFDPKKKYPVVVFTYGGPTSKVVTQEMQPWLLRQWLADQGFIVVAIDNRGTAGRGRDWEKAVYQKFGTVPLDDQVNGLAALCDKFPELDRERVGIVGGSFGGYMAANGVLRRPDVFKAAVAMAPVTDWEDYDTHYTERYMGLLPESKKAYEEASLLPLAKELRRPLLLIHGTADDNVNYRHTLRLTDALVRADRDFEVLPLPGVTHMISRDPVVERVWARTATFFKHHLGEPK